MLAKVADDFEHGSDKKLLVDLFPSRPKHHPEYLSVGSAFFEVFVDSEVFEQVFGGEGRSPCVPINPKALICRVDVVDLTPTSISAKIDLEFWISPTERERVLGLVKTKSATDFQQPTLQKRTEKPPSA